MGYYIVKNDPESIREGVRQHWSTYREVRRALRRERDGHELAAVQQDKLQALVHDAYANTAYYRQVMEERGLRPEDIKTPADLVKLPFLTKAVLQSQFAALLSRRQDFGRIARNRTSGSTGQPVTSLFEWDVHQSVLSIAKFRQQFAWEVRGGERILYVVPRRFHFAGNVYPEKLIDLNGMHEVWQIHPTEQGHDWLQVMQHVRPTILYGNPYLMHQLIDELEPYREQIPKPKLLLSSFELLDKPSRERFTSFFEAELCDVYGLSEIGDVAYECPAHNGHHIHSDYLVVEVIKDGQPVVSEEGQIAVTSLSNRCMPFLRYLTGDVGTLETAPCSCGRQTPRLTKIKGRNVDFISLPDGSKVSPYDLMDLLNISGVSRFQILQERPDRLTVKLARDVSIDLARVLEKRLAQRVGPALHIEIERVDELVATSSDKMRVVLSQMKGV